MNWRLVGYSVVLLAFVAVGYYVSFSSCESKWSGLDSPSNNKSSLNTERESNRNSPCATPREITCDCSSSSSILNNSDEEQIEPCLVAYVREAEAYEFFWTHHELFSQIWPRCRCAISPITPGDYWKLVEKTSDPNAFPFKYSILQLDHLRYWHENDKWSNWPEWKRKVYGDAVILHYGDETAGDHIDKDYEHFRVVYRQYCDNYTYCSVKYLQSDDAKDGSRIRWIPIGYSNNMNPLSALSHRPPSKRKLAFFFSGSLRNEDRTLLNTTMNNNYDVKQLGVYHATQGWVNADQLGDASKMMTHLPYNENIYNAKTVLCPRGNNPDQFRIYETLEAGAIPVVRMQGFHHLDYLTELGFHFINISTWDTVTETIKQVSDSKSELSSKLDAWQRANIARWQRLKYRLAREFADSVCRR